PRGITLSLMIVTAIYMLVTLVLTGMVQYSKLNVSDAVAFALRSVGLGWAGDYVSIVAILTLITVCISMTYGLSRMIYSISRDGLLPQMFSQVTPKSRVPRNATLLSGFGAMIFAGMVPLASLAEFVNITTLSYLMLLAVAIIVLRHQKGLPKEGEFRMPLVPILPIVAIVVCFIFMIQYQWQTWIAFLIALLVGILIYFVYGYRHSTLHKGDNNNPSSTT
ncbi:APC family permease, partial [Streptococcus hyovaginalis]